MGMMQDCTGDVDDSRALCDSVILVTSTTLQHSVYPYTLHTLSSHTQTLYLGLPQMGLPWVS